MVFQRRAGQAQALSGLYLPGGQGGLAARVFDVLRLVENQQAVAVRVERLEVAGQQGVGGENDVVLADLLEQRPALGPVRVQLLRLAKSRSRVSACTRFMYSSVTKSAAAGTCCTAPVSRMKLDRAVNHWSTCEALPEGGDIESQGFGWRHPRWDWARGRGISSVTATR